MSGRTYVFLGGMNAMPMMYAHELKKKGNEVLYFVDSPKWDLLSRPESHYPDISYPYPSWIIEWVIKTQIFVPFFRWIYSIAFLKKCKKYTNQATTKYYFVLNGFFISLAPILKKHGKVISLSHGSDLLLFSDMESLPSIYADYKNRSIFKYLPGRLSFYLIEILISRQFHGFCSSDKFIYFPKFLNLTGARVIRNIEESGGNFVSRYDVSFSVFGNISREFKKREGNLILFSAARIVFDGSSSSLELSKGSNKILCAVSEFRKECPNVELHLIDKGPDVEKAKALSEELGISDIVTWHKQMSFKELINYYLKSDVCFDSVGESWMAGVGAHAMWLGKPVISNVSKLINSGWFPESCPVLNAESTADILRHLRDLVDDSYRESVSVKSIDFSEKWFSVDKVINEAFL